MNLTIILHTIPPTGLGQLCSPAMQDYSVVVVQVIDSRVSEMQATRAKVGRSDEVPFFLEHDVVCYDALW